jgi:dienelactone hydrolase
LLPLLKNVTDHSWMTPAMPAERIATWLKNLLEACLPPLLLPRNTTERGAGRFTSFFLSSIACSMLSQASGEILPDQAALFLDFEQEHSGLRLLEGAKIIGGRYGKALEFTSAIERAEIDLPKRLHGISTMTVGGWFHPRRRGEQYFIFRGVPQVDERGNRMFQREVDWVNFVLGTDERGFFLGTINGNGFMPFPHVTVNELGIDEWHQLVVVKNSRGHHSFYQNGKLIHTDEHATAGGKTWPFSDIATGEPIRLAMPLGGLIGEVWVFAYEVSATEIEQDFAAKKDLYHPALPGKRTELRELNSHPAATLWKEPITKERWPEVRKSIVQGALKVLGPFPKEKPPLDPKILSEEDCGTYVRRKVSIQVQPKDRMPAYLLIPKKIKGRAAAIICFYGTTSGAGKETTVGLSGRKPGTASDRNASFAIDMAEAGFVAFAADYLRDGERIAKGRRPYDTTDFYEEFPDWSIHGKDIWDTSRAIDYLETLDFVDPDKIGMTGHSYGGHSTIFTMAFEPRIKVAVSNGPVSDFRHHGLHWGVPKGGGNSQSLPAMRPYVLDPTLPIPVTFYEFTSLIAPRPLLVGQAVGERRPMEEENYAAVSQVYSALGVRNRVRYHWYAGDHDFPPEARKAAVEWFKRWLTRERSDR